MKNDAIDTAVANTLGSAKGKTAIQVSIEAINAFSKGQADLTKAKEAYEKKHGDLSVHVFKVCQEAVKLAGNDLGLAVRYAKNLFSRAEEAYKQGHLVDGKPVAVAELLPSWPPIKSTMLSYMDKKELDPGKFKSAQEFSKAGRAPVERSTGGSQSGTEPKAEDFMTDGMSVVFDHLTRAIKKAPAEVQNAIAVKVSALAQEIEALTKTHKPKVDKGEEVAKAA